MVVLRWLAFVTLVLCLVSPLQAAAASLTVNGGAGDPGLPGQNGVAADPNNPGQPEVDTTSGGAGGAGGAATVPVTSPDSTNSATANGGAGGAGGSGGNGAFWNGSPASSVGSFVPGSGGAGGAGGDANASAANAAPTLPEGMTQASATGGQGGAGGLGGNSSLYGADSSGQGGKGGAAVADSLATGNVFATSQASATGGTGGNGGDAADLSFYTQSNAAGSGGDAGDAHAHASASSASSLASATASATGGNGGSGGENAPFTQLALPILAAGGRGGDATALADANALSGDATAHAIALGGSGGTGAATSGSASAAAQSITGSATATAEATGGAATTETGSGGVASPTATATSEKGNATATAIARTGAAIPAHFDGSLVSSNLVGGSPGTDATLVDAVSGSASGRLTLTQQAIASDTGELYGEGGSAHSQLHASNPGGGELVASTTSSGGAGAGSADALVSATVSNSARVQAFATATAGAVAMPYYFETTQYGVDYLVGGTASATATAQGLGLVEAHSTASGTNSPGLHAATAALSVGPIAGARTSLDAAANAQSALDYGFTFPPGYAQELPGSVSAATELHAADAPLTSAPVLHTGEANLFGAPNPGDVGTWALGHPNVTAGLEAGAALGLGSVAGAGNSLNVITYSGQLELDLTNSALDPQTRLGLAFLDSASTGLGFDALHLTLSRSGTVLFDRSYTTPAAALADLDDHVFRVGLALTPGDATTPVVLAFSFELPSGSDATAFGFNFAMLIVHEPEAAGLVLGSLALVFGFSRRRAACRPA